METLILVQLTLKLIQQFSQVSRNKSNLTELIEFFRGFYNWNSFDFVSLCNVLDRKAGLHQSKRAKHFFTMFLWWSPTNAKFWGKETTRKLLELCLFKVSPSFQISTQMAFRFKLDSNWILCGRNVGVRAVFCHHVRVGARLWAIGLSRVVRKIPHFGIRIIYCF